MTTEEILLITNGLSAIAGLWFWRRSDSYKKEAKEASDAHDNLLSVFTKAGNDFESFRTESAAIINQSAENNAKLVKELEANSLLIISYKELAASYKETCESIQEELDKSMEQNSEITNELVEIKSDRQKLFDIAKGATAKLAEMNVELDRVLGEKTGLVEAKRIKDLKEREGITVYSKEEEFIALKLYEEAGFVWIHGGEKPTSFLGELSFPHSIVLSSTEGRIANTLNSDKFKLSQFINL